MEGERGGVGKINDLLAQARNHSGIAASVIYSMLVDREDNEEVYIRQMVASALAAEYMAEMRAMRRELSAFLKAMSK